MRVRETNPPADFNPELIALQVLGWILSDEDRAQRLLDVTGLDPQTMRANLTDQSMQSATLDFLCAHEPDLIACSVALDIAPETIAAAARAFNGVYE